jgi:hypothetical protein
MRILESFWASYVNMDLNDSAVQPHYLLLVELMTSPNEEVEAKKIGEEKAHTWQEYCCVVNDSPRGELQVSFPSLKRELYQ